MPKADWGSGASGAISGASTGATIGGPVGAGIGGVIGGVAGLFGSGKKKKKKRSTMDKRQQQINEQQFQSLLGEGPLADLYNYDPEAANAVFDQNIGKKAHRDFAENTVPTITGAFRKDNLQNSSYVGGALAKEGRNVQENLDALRSQYLYGEQKEAKNAKRNAIENFQNRTNFDYDTAAPSNGGFDIGQILKNISPEMMSGLNDYFSKGKPGMGVA